ncbi:hypothetical protein GGC47_004466 [Bosea sp. OAE752]|uniref:hypothetical protein n=1 Tax=Bosea sp. OAE752 TaxID=2663873 RepID=UPI003D1D5EC0
MPFSSLKDPVDLARAHGALEAAWLELKREIPPEDHEPERVRLAYIVAAFALAAQSEKELVRRSVERFREKLP